MHQIKYLKLIVGLFLVVIFLNSLGLAETPPAKYGRLADGRAYRIDQSGYQLIDSIAELEVANDDLRKQVENLENKTQQQNIQLKKLAGDIPLNEPLANEEKCSDEITLARQQIFSLQDQLAQLQRLSRDKSRVQQNFADYQREIREELEAKNKQMLSSQQVLDSQTKKMAQLNNELENAQSRIMQLQVALKEKEVNEENYRKEVSLLKSQLQTATAAINTDRAKLVEYKQTNGQIIPVSAAIQRGTSPVESIDLRELKRQLTTQLSRINSQIIKRKDLLDSLKNAKKGVLVSAQQLVTSTGQTLDALRIAVNNLTQDTDVVAVQDGISQIEKILQDDIKTLSRLTR